jgi:hypothetical protein
VEVVSKPKRCLLGVFPYCTFSVRSTFLKRASETDTKDKILLLAYSAWQAMDGGVSTTSKFIFNIISISLSILNFTLQNVKQYFTRPIYNEDGTSGRPMRTLHCS